jgi:hypothetical protein
MKNLAFIVVCAWMSIPVYAQRRKQPVGQTIGTVEQPKYIGKRSKIVPENEWYTVDKETLFYHGEESNVAEVCRQLVSDREGAFRVHDTTVNFEADDFTIDAPVWFLSNGLTLICINKKGYGRGMLMLKPT